MRSTSRPNSIVALACLALAGGGCPNKREPPDAAPAVQARPRASPPAPALPPVAPLGRKPRVLYAAARVHRGRVVYRGWLHVRLDGTGLARLPRRWGVPYDARVAVGRPGDRVAWVAMNGRVGLSSDAGARQLARDGEPAVTPAFTFRPGEILFARRRGDLLRWRRGAISRVTAGPVRDLVLGPARRRYLFVRAGRELVEGNLSAGVTRTLYRSPGTRVRLLGPRFWADGSVLVRERDGPRAHLLRISTKGPLSRVPLPPGVLRAFAPAPPGRILVGMAHRRGRRRFGELYLQDVAGKARRQLGSWARTLPLARLSCTGGAALLLDSSRPMARLVSVPLRGRGRARTLTGSSWRVLDPHAWTLWCPAPSGRHR